MRLHATQHLATFTSSLKGSHYRLLKSLTIDAWLLASEITLAALCYIVLFSLFNKIFYYMAESVFAMQLLNLRSVTHYTDQNF